MLPPSDIENLFLNIYDDADLLSLEYKYYSVDDLNNLHSEINSKLFLSIFHTNIRSLNSNNEKLIDFIKACSCNFDIIIISEIWSTNIAFYKRLLDNYTFYYTPPASNNKAGGVAVYIKSCISAVLRTECYSMSNYFETLCLDVTINNSTYFLLCIYRHPNTPVEPFIDYISQTLSKIPPTRKSFIIGDINLDLARYDSDLYTKLYVDELCSKSYLPLVFLPTRITTTTATIIDHVFTNYNPVKEIKTGIVATDISDHLSNFIFLTKESFTPTPNDRPFIRIYSQKNINNFISKLTQTQWLDVLNENCPNAAYNKFYNLFTDAFSSSFPLVKASIKWCKNKRWVSGALRKSIHTKSLLYKKWIQNKNTENETTYKNYQKILKQLLEKAKNTYFNSLFNHNNHNIKALWTNIQQVFSTKTSKSGSRVDKIVHNNISYTDNKNISNIFAEYFSTIGPKLAEKFDTELDNFKKYLPQPSLQSAYFPSIAQQEVYKEIITLKDIKTCGPDNINPFSVKLARDYITVPLTHIYNLSLSLGIFPERLKISKTVPIFKKGNKEQCNNYRPIAISSIFSKVFEKLLHSRFSSYLNKFKIIYDYQFGFRKNHSTTSALLEVTNMINTNATKNYTIGIFLDLQKAFDTVNHKILLTKLENLGIRGNILKLIESFLHERQIYTNINETKSNKFSISCGLPQGTVLSPLLFLLYVNDIHKATPDNQIRLFADDSNIFIIDTTLERVYTRANQALINITEWLQANKLSLNVEKTNYMLFKPTDQANEYINTHNLTLSIDNKNIERTDSVRYLGVLISENLTWNQYINEIKNYVNSYSGIIYKYRKNLSNVTAKNIYFSYIHSKVNYGLELYGTSPKYILHPLEISCNRILRYLQGQPRLYPSINLYKNYNTLPIYSQFNFLLLTLMFKYIHQKEFVPPAIKVILQQNKDIHKYNTRNQLDFNHNHYHRFQKDPLILASHLWNKLPPTLKTAQSIHIFKRGLKPHILNTTV